MWWLEVQGLGLWLWLQKDNRHEFGYDLIYTNVGYLEKLNDMFVVVVAEDIDMNLDTT